MSVRRREAALLLGRVLILLCISTPSFAQGADAGADAEAGAGVMDASDDAMSSEDRRSPPLPPAPSPPPAVPEPPTIERPTQPIAPAPPPSGVPPSAIAGPSGFGIHSADDKYRLLLHWVLQTDLHGFIADKPMSVPSSNAFVTRFAGMQMDAIVLERFHSQVLVDFSQSKLTLFDAWVEATAVAALRLRVGKFQVPMSEERLTPAIMLPFVSTSFAALLLPSRDTGIQVHGVFGDGIVKYNVALTNGGTAGVFADGDVDSHKDGVGRLFVRPFMRTNIGPLRKLGLGVGGSYGLRNGTKASPQLSILRTYGGLPFFAYRNDPTETPGGRVSIATGLAARVAPHATWAWGPVAAYADWAHQREEVNGTIVISNAWSVVSSIVLTGEDAEPLSYIAPKRPFDLSKGHLGTFLLVGGIGGLQVSDSAFTSGAADPSVASQASNVVGGGFNWYPTRGIALLTSFGHMTFDAYQGATYRPDENVVVGRFQMVL